MGVQYIFVVETNSKCKSDWIYIRDTIERFYQWNQPQIKLSVVYMNGKYSLQGTTQGRYLTGGVPPVRFSM